ncbi:MAG: hypothetical protein HQL19_08125 [Candidatus Omnitrophica bacterium]|nr:hypothetical protein [Candidatus Omnitrophota bacterium]
MGGALRTTWIQKAALLVFGLFLTLVALEGLLRLGGFMLDMAQSRANRASFSGNEFRILCVGESTTALGGENSYPFQLQEILQKRHPELQVKTINKGMVSKTSQDILEQFDKNLKEYKPQLVIGMIGINEIDHVRKHNVYLMRAHAFFRQFRVYKLFALLSAHIREKIHPAPLPRILEGGGPEYAGEIEALQGSIVAAEERKTAELAALKAAGASDEAVALVTGKLDAFQALCLVKMAVYYRNRGDNTRATEFFLLATQKNPSEPVIYVEWGQMFRDAKMFVEATTMYRRALDVQPANFMAGFELAGILGELGKIEEARSLFLVAAQYNVDDIWLYHKVGIWLKDHGFFEDAEKVFLKGIEKERNAAFYEQLMIVNQKMGRTKEAKKYADLYVDRNREFFFYPLETVENYNKIVMMSMKAGARVVAMQYPLKDLAPLKDILGTDKGIVFVENKKNFQTGGNYWEYFSDNFAIDFGHCTRKGNALIAENLADAIDREILKKK